MKKCFFFILFFAALPALLTALDCSVCRKNIRGRYLSANGKNFCSQHCFQTTWPECSRCHRKCRQYFTAGNGKIFCSKACLASTFPPCVICGKKGEKSVQARNIFGKTAIYCMDCRHSKRCYFCMLPSGNEKILPDGRTLCRSCSAETVDDPAEVQRIFQQVRSDLARDFGFDPAHRIRLNIVDLPTLKRRMTQSVSSDDGKPMGVMLYTEEREEITGPGGRKRERVKEKRCRIYVLHTMPRDFLFQTFAHELTHDHLRHHVGEVKDQVAEEGFCELIAALYNSRRGKTYLNQAKEQNPSPVYGAGYRKMRDLYRKTQSLPATMRHIR